MIRTLRGSALPNLIDQLTVGAAVTVSGPWGDTPATVTDFFDAGFGRYAVVTREDGNSQRTPLITERPQDAESDRIGIYIA